MTDTAESTISTRASQESEPVTDYCFAEFRLSAQHQCLYGPGEPVQLTTKIYYLLLTFVAHPGEVLTKDAIVDAVWPGQVVTDTALAKQVLRLRRILNDASRDMPLIETHRGVGYRLTCPVTVGPVVAAEAGAPSGEPWHRRSVGLLSAAAGLLIMPLLLIVYVSATSSSTQTQQVATPALAVIPVDGSEPAFSHAAAEYIAGRLGGRASVVPSVSRADDNGDNGADTALQSLRVSHLTGLAQTTAVKLSQHRGGYLLDITYRGSAEGQETTQITGREIGETLDAGADWLRLRVGAESGLAIQAAPTRDAYALDSYFRGLQLMRAGGSRQRAAEYFRAAVSSDGDFLQAHLRLAECESALGRQYEAIAAASSLLARPELAAQPDLALETYLLLARAYRSLGDREQARERLAQARQLIDENSNPYHRLNSLAAMALMALLDRDYAGAQDLTAERLQLAQDIYPLPSFIATIHLELASYLDQLDQPERLLHHAESARTLAEESGDAALLISSYRYLASHFFTTNDIDSAVQLAVSAQPFLDKVAATEDKAYFLQFAGMALNLRGLFDLATDYTRRLRESGKQAGNPMYGAIADFTVMHRLYVQGALEEARAMARSTRERFATDAVTRAAIPRALAFEATVAARIAPPKETLALLTEFDEQYAEFRPGLEQTLLRARGHLAVRQGNIDSGIALLRESEKLHREQGHHGVAAFVGYEIAEIRLAHEATAPWDDIERLSAEVDFDYQLARLEAQAHARDGNFLAAAASLENSRLRSNDLWSVKDELLLERYRSAMAMREPSGSSGPALGSGSDGT